MPSLGDLVVNLSANTSKFDKGISRSKQGVMDFGSVTKKVAAGVKASLITMTGGAVAAAGAIYGLTSRIGDLAAINDKATQTGLSGAFLQRLEFAADQSGVSIETLQAGMKRLLMEMGKSGETMTLDQKIASIGEQMSNAKSQAEKVKIATQAFGKAGVEMTGLFANGMSDLNRLLAEAARLGIGIDDKALARAAAADDAIQRMKFTFSALIDQIAVTMAPAFESMTNKVTEMLVPVNQIMIKFNQLPNQVEFLGNVLDATFEVVKFSIVEKWDTMLADMAKSSRKMGEEVVLGFVDPAGWGAKVGEDFNALQNVNTESLDAARNRLADLIKQIEAMPGAQGAQLGAVPIKKADLAEVSTKAWSALTDAIVPNVNEMKNRVGGQAAQWQGMLQNWFGGPANLLKTQSISLDMAQGEPKKNESYQSLSAAKAGSSEALSTILYSSFRQGKNPQVQATQHQTKQQAKQHAELMNVLKDGGLAMMGGWP